MNQMPGKVAIITRTKNRPLLLNRCIESVLQQTYRNWVHVIINDGGDAATVEGTLAPFAARYAGRSIVVHNPVSQGMQNASNRAIQSVESEFVTIHDDDDSWAPLFLEECVRHLELAGVNAVEQGVAVQTHWITEEIDSWGKVTELHRQDFMPFESVSLFQLASRNSFPPIAFLYRRSVHEAIGYFDQKFNELGDYDFNLRFLTRYDIGTIKNKLANYHWRHQANGSSYGNTVTDGLAAHKTALVRMQNHYLREDLAAQKMGMGFLINMAVNFEAQTGWVHGLYNRTEGVTNALQKTVRKMEHYERLIDGVLVPWKARTLPFRFVDHMAENWQSPKSAANGLPTSQLPELFKRLESAKALSLDIFDTTLLRLVRKPTDVFLYMQAGARKILKEPKLGFVELRINAEQSAREELRGRTGSNEVNLDQIYAMLGIQLECDAATLNSLKALEIATEQTLCYANPEIVKLLVQARQGNQSLVFVSDMYLPSSEVLALLERNGFKEIPLLLSSESLVSKHDGELYDQMLERLKHTPGDLLHVGDNPHSDVERAQGRGLNAHHWNVPLAQLPLVDQQHSFSGAWDGDLASSLYTGLARRRRLQQPLPHGNNVAYWKMIGYEVIGPLYHAFTAWLAEQVKQKGYKKLFFLARDGYHLVKVFDLFRAKYNLACEGDYLFASRRLLNFPRIEKLDEDSLIFLVSSNPGMRVRDFIERIGLAGDDFQKLVWRFGFRSLEQKITSKDGIFLTEDFHQGMRKLMRELGPQILELAQKERTKLLDYFNEMGLFQPDVALVDIGWQASSLLSVNRLRELNGSGAKIPGLYFGTWKYARPTVDAGLTFESFFMHLDQPKHRSALVAESVELIESFFTAPHPSITGVERKNGKWEALYGVPETDAASQANLQIATEAAFEFVQDALEIWPLDQTLTPPFGYLETVFDRVLRNPRIDEAIALGQFSLRNSFGGTGPLRHVAKLPALGERILHKHALQEAYDHCYWKRGFIAQLGQRSKKYVKA